MWSKYKKRCPLCQSALFPTAINGLRRKWDKISLFTRNTPPSLLYITFFSLFFSSIFYYFLKGWNLILKNRQIKKFDTSYVSRGGKFPDWLISAGSVTLTSSNISHCWVPVVQRSIMFNNASHKIAWHLHSQGARVSETSLNQQWKVHTSEIRQRDPSLFCSWKIHCWSCLLK